MFVFFFFQAEDGIRDYKVTGVQTCALPILRPSWLQSLPLSRGAHRLLLPLLPRAVESLHVEPVDVLVSSSSSFIKGLSLPNGARQVCYCHSPTRYLWDWSANYVREEVPRVMRGLVRSM